MRPTSPMGRYPTSLPKHATANTLWQSFEDHEFNHRDTENTKMPNNRDSTRFTLKTGGQQAVNRTGPLHLPFPLCALSASVVERRQKVLRFLIRVHPFPSVVSAASAGHALQSFFRAYY
jgi:hypothetical protein